LGGDEVSQGAKHGPYRGALGKMFTTSKSDATTRWRKRERER